MALFCALPVQKRRPEDASLHGRDRGRMSGAAERLTLHAAGGIMQTRARKGCASRNRTVVLLVTVNNNA